VFWGCGTVSLDLQVQSTGAHLALNRHRFVMLMTAQTPGLQDKREWGRRSDLLQAVLRYLTMNGPTSWMTLYLHFDVGGTGEIGAAIGHLTVCKHIVVE